MGERLASLAVAFVSVVLPLGLLMMAVGIAAAVASGGWVWTLKPLMPNFGKLNPLAGLPRLLSTRQLGDAMKACLLASCWVRSVRSISAARSSRSAAW